MATHSKRIEPAAGDELASLTVAEYMQLSARKIVEHGGELTANSAGHSIYPARADLFQEATAYDRRLRRVVRVKIRLRLTVEVAPFDSDAPSSA